MALSKVLPGLQRIFILPTLSGLVVLASVVIILMMGAIFQSNPVLLAGFIVFAFLMVVMLSNHSHLGKITTRARIPHRIFPNTEFNISFDSAANGLEGFEVTLSTARVLSPVLPSNTLKLSFANRGLQSLQPLWIRSAKPFQLFKSWKRFNPSELPELVVLASPRLSARADLVSVQEQPRLQSLGERVGHKEFDSASSFSDVDWKRFSRGATAFARDRLSSTDQKTHIKLITSKPDSSLGFEELLSHLTQLLLDFESKNCSVEIQFPNSRKLLCPALRQGYDQALKALARLQLEDIS